MKYEIDKNNVFTGRRSKWGVEVPTLPRGFYNSPTSFVWDDGIKLAEGIDLLEWYVTDIGGMEKDELDEYIIDTDTLASMLNRKIGTKPMELSVFGYMIEKAGVSRDRIREFMGLEGVMVRLSRALKDGHYMDVTMIATAPPSSVALTEADLLAINGVVDTISYTALDVFASILNEPSPACDADAIHALRGTTPDA